MSMMKERREIMNEVNRTLFIPLYGKARVSRMNIIIRDPTAEAIWEREAFPIHGKSRSKWLAYNMAMRARVFDDWTDRMLAQNPRALVLHVGCGLDSRCRRVTQPYDRWIDCDFPGVIAVRRKYYGETEHYRMAALDASDPAQVDALPDADTAIVVLEGLSMYLTNEQLHAFLQALHDKYPNLHILMDIYTEFGARASKVKNPVNDVGVTELYGVDDIDALLAGTGIRLQTEHSFTPAYLVSMLKPAERAFFKLMFTGKMYSRIYRLPELAKTKISPA